MGQTRKQKKIKLVIRNVLDQTLRTDQIQIQGKIRLGRGICKIRYFELRWIIIRISYDFISCLVKLSVRKTN